MSLIQVIGSERNRKTLKSQPMMELKLNSIDSQKMPTFEFFLIMNTGEMSLIQLTDSERNKKPQKSQPVMKSKLVSIQSQKILMLKFVPIANSSQMSLISSSNRILQCNYSS
jgi:phosphotransferase system IIA component